MRLGTSDHSFTQVFLNIHQSGLLVVLFACYMAGATGNCCYSLLHGWCHMELLLLVVTWLVPQETAAVGCYMAGPQETAAIGY